MLLSIVLCLVANRPQQGNYYAMFALGKELNAKTTLVETDLLVKDPTLAHEVQISQDGTIIDTSDTTNAAQVQQQSEEEILLRVISRFFFGLSRINFQ